MIENQTKIECDCLQVKMSPRKRRRFESDVHCAVLTRRRACISALSPLPCFLPGWRLGGGGEPTDRRANKWR